MIYNLDVLDFLAQVETNSVNLAFLDPPYNIGIFCKMPENDYLAWCKQWLVEVDRVLVDNGALWICHKNPDVLVDLSMMVDRLGRSRKNWITWDKYNGANSGQRYIMNRTKLHPQGKRTFDQDAEYLVYHASKNEQIRKYLDGERRRANFTYQMCNDAIGHPVSGGGMSTHFFSSPDKVKVHQWTLPTREKYEMLKMAFNKDGDNYLPLNYDEIVYTFNNPGRLSSVWQIPPATKSPHPTPKPELLLETIIKATSNPGDLVLDPFCGSGTTAAVAQNLNRRFVVNDYDEKWCEYTRKRLRVKRLL